MSSLLRSTSARISYEYEYIYPYILIVHELTTHNIRRASDVFTSWQYARAPFTRISPVATRAPRLGSGRGSLAAAPSPLSVARRRRRPDSLSPTLLFSSLSSLSSRQLGSTHTDILVRTRTQSQSRVACALQLDASESASGFWSTLANEFFEEDAELQIQATLDEDGVPRPRFFGAHSHSRSRSHAHTHMRTHTHSLLQVVFARRMSNGRALARR